MLLPPALAVELGALAVEDPELVTLGRLDEPEGTAELLPVADPDAPEVPSTLGRPVTTTDVGWSGCAIPVRESGGRVISGGRRQLPLDDTDEDTLDEALDEALEEAVDDED